MRLTDYIKSKLRSFQGSKVELNKMKAPLLEIDEALKSFAKVHGMVVSKNYHDWPERSLEWSRNNIHRLIEIWLEDEKEMTFNFWICASLDKGGKRYWKNMYIRKNASFIDIRENLQELLKESIETLESWNETDLHFATALSLK